MPFYVAILKSTPKNFAILVTSITSMVILSYHFYINTDEIISAKQYKYHCKIRFHF